MDVSSTFLPAATKKKLDIIVVGGSLGGLSAGVALRSLGHNVTILERNPTELLHDQGAGIVAGGDTLAFFKRYDRCGRTLAVTSTGRQFLDREGKVVLRREAVHNMTSWDLVYYILRANFDGVDSKYCKVPEPVDMDGRVQHLHGRKVTGIRHQGDKVEVFFSTADRKDGSLVADFVIGADGPSSTIRGLFLDNVRRTYAGYVALRGTVPEAEVSDHARQAFSENLTFFHGPGLQILAYLIPGRHGALEPGKRLINFVYYTNFPAKSLDEPSPELAELMTDINGERHRITIPPGKTNPAAWETQLQLASERLPPQFAEIVRATKKPFIQAVTDVISPQNQFLDGKVVLIGDALAGFRPHTVASTSQACFDAMVLADLVEGKVSRQEWKKQTMGYARVIQKRGIDMGERSQHEILPLEEYIKDRDVASRPRAGEEWPDWAVADL